jgi:hypothetical protein
MPELEGPDDQITLKRAAEVAGLSIETLQHAARDGRLQAERPARDWFTTRRHLHRYLAGRKRGPVAPLPADYVTPEGEDPIHG